jgi:hypothetical protein
MARAMTPPPNNEDAQRASKIGTRPRKKEEYTRPRKKENYDNKGENKSVHMNDRQLIVAGVNHVKPIFE